MPLVRIDRKPGKGKSSPVIRIYKSGQISFNAAAYRVLGEPEYAELYVEPGARICVKPVPSGLEHAYRVARHPKAGGLITAGRLVSGHLADLPMPAHLDAHMIDGMLTAFLPGKAVAA